jgi:molecular chaperone HscB
VRVRRVSPVLGDQARDDHFALFGLPRRYRVDLGDLEERYLARSREAHPDRFVAADARARVAALQASMRLNEAYRILKKPVARAEYLLGLEGMGIGEHDKLEVGFLAEMLELREELAEARAAGDRARVGALGAEMAARRDAALARVGDEFAGWEASGDRGALERIKRDLVLLRYVRRYLDEVAGQDPEDV